MPGFVKTPHDEKKWSEAKHASGKETKSGSKSYWKLANFIFHRMKKSQGIEKAEELIKSFNMPCEKVEKQEQGIHPTTKDTGMSLGGKGISPVGEKVRAGHKIGPAIMHQNTLKEMKAQPKPNLPKSEEMAKSAISVPNPMKMGEQTVASKTPKATKLPDASAKPSVFFKSEDCKHPSTRKLCDFMTKCRR